MDEEEEPVETEEVTTEEILNFIGNIDEVYEQLREVDYLKHNLKIARRAVSAARKESEDYRDSLRRAETKIYEYESSKITLEDHNKLQAEFETLTAEYNRLVNWAEVRYQNANKELQLIKDKYNKSENQKNELEEQVKKLSSSQVQALESARKRTYTKKKCKEIKVEVLRESGIEQLQNSVLEVIVNNERAKQMELKNQLRIIQELHQKEIDRLTERLKIEIKEKDSLQEQLQKKINTLNNQLKNEIQEKEKLTDKIDCLQLQLNLSKDEVENDNAIQSENHDVSDMPILVTDVNVHDKLEMEVLKLQAQDENMDLSDTADPTDPPTDEINSIFKEMKCQAHVLPLSSDLDVKPQKRLTNMIQKAAVEPEQVCNINSELPLRRQGKKMCAIKRESCSAKRTILKFRHMLDKKPFVATKKQSKKLDAARKKISHEVYMAKKLYHKFYRVFNRKLAIMFRKIKKCDSNIMSQKLNQFCHGQPVSCCSNAHSVCCPPKNEKRGTQRDPTIPRRSSCSCEPNSWKIEKNEIMEQQKMKEIIRQQLLDNVPKWHTDNYFTYPSGESDMESSLSQSATKRKKLRKQRSMQKQTSVGSSDEDDCPVKESKANQTLYDNKMTSRTDQDIDSSETIYATVQGSVDSGYVKTDSGDESDLQNKKEKAQQTISINNNSQEASLENVNARHSNQKLIELFGSDLNNSLESNCTSNSKSSGASATKYLQRVEYERSVNFYESSENDLLRGFDDGCYSSVSQKNVVATSCLNEIATIAEKPSKVVQKQTELTKQTQGTHYKEQNSNIILNDLNLSDDSLSGTENEAKTKNLLIDNRVESLTCKVVPKTPVHMTTKMLLSNTNRMLDSESSNHSNCTVYKEVKSPYTCKPAQKVEKPSSCVMQKTKSVTDYVGKKRIAHTPKPAQNEENSLRVNYSEKHNKGPACWGYEGSLNRGSELRTSGKKHNTSGELSDAKPPRGKKYTIVGRKAGAKNKRLETSTDSEPQTGYEKSDTDGKRSEIKDKICRISARKGESKNGEQEISVEEHEITRGKHESDNKRPDSSSETKSQIHRISARNIAVKSNVCEVNTEESGIDGEKSETNDRVHRTSIKTIGAKSGAYEASSRKYETTVDKFGVTKEKPGAKGKKSETEGRVCKISTRKLGSECEKPKTATEELGIPNGKPSTESKKLETKDQILRRSPRKAGAKCDTYETSTEELGSADDALEPETDSEKLGISGNKLVTNGKIHPISGRKVKISNKELETVCERTNVDESESGSGKLEAGCKKSRINSRKLGFNYENHDTSASEHGASVEKFSTSDKTVKRQTKGRIFRSENEEFSTSKKAHEISVDASETSGGRSKIGGKYRRCHEASKISTEETTTSESEHVMTAGKYERISDRKPGTKSEKSAGMEVSDNEPESADQNPEANSRKRKITDSHSETKGGKCSKFENIVKNVEEKNEKRKIYGTLEAGIGKLKFTGDKSRGNGLTNEQLLARQRMVEVLKSKPVDKSTKQTSFKRPNTRPRVEFVTSRNQVDNVSSLEASVSSQLNLKSVWWDSISSQNQMGDLVTDGLPKELRVSSDRTLRSTTVSRNLMLMDPLFTPEPKTFPVEPTVFSHTELKGVTSKSSASPKLDTSDWSDPDSMRVDLESPFSPEPEIDEQELFQYEPKIIPLEKNEVPKGENLKLNSVEQQKEPQLRYMLIQLLHHYKSDGMAQEVTKAFLDKNPHVIARLVLGVVSQDIHGKAKIFTYRRAPLLTTIQRIMLGFLVELEQKGVRGVTNIFLNQAERLLLTMDDPAHISPVARIHAAICKLHFDYLRMRLMIVKALLFMGDAAIPYLHIVLCSWLELIPLHSDDLSSPGSLEVRTVMQIIRLKKCTQPEYNLQILLNLLCKHHGYSFDGEDSEKLLEELFKCCIGRTSNTIIYLTIALCLNLDKRFVFKQVDKLKVRLAIVSSDDQMCAAIKLVAAIISQYCEDHEVADFVSTNEEWLKQICVDSYPQLVRNVAKDALSRLAVK